MAFGLGLIQGFANIFRQGKANKALEKLQSQDPTYQQSPYAGDQLGIARQLYNGRMFGAPQLEQNIYTNQANTASNIDKNATDSAQALALAGQSQGQTNKSLQDLQIQESQNKYNMLKNLNEAYGTMINEGDKSYQDQVRRFGDTAQIQGQIQQNKTNALNGIFNGLNSDVDSFVGAGSAGGFDQIFKNLGLGKGNGMSSAVGGYSSILPNISLPSAKNNF